MIAPGIKRGTAELAVLSVLEDGPLHGYEMARRIEEQTHGSLAVYAGVALSAALQAGKARLGARRLGNQRYGTAPTLLSTDREGKKKLAPIRREWDELFRALKRLTKVSHA